MSLHLLWVTWLTFSSTPFGGARGGEHAEECLRDEIRKSRFGGGGDVRHGFEARRRIDRKDADLSTTMQGDHLRGDIHKADGDFSAEQVVHRRRHALVGDMNDVEPAGHLLEHLDGDVRDRAVPPEP